MVEEDQVTLDLFRPLRVLLGRSVRGLGTNSASRDCPRGSEGPRKVNVPRDRTHWGPRFRVDSQSPLRVGGRPPTLFTVRRGHDCTSTGGPVPVRSGAPGDVMVSHRQVFPFYP